MKSLSCIVYGVRYKSAHEVATDLGVDYGTVRYRLRFPNFPNMFQNMKLADLVTLDSITFACNIKGEEFNCRNLTVRTATGEDE